MRDSLQSRKCARKLKCLADPERLRIIQCLRKGPKNVTEIADELQISLVNASHHLGVLRQAEIVIDERQGRFIVYRLDPRVYQPEEPGEENDHLDLGCCRLEIPREGAKA